MRKTKSLPWILTCKTSQPNSFGYESKGSLQDHAEAHTACLAPVFLFKFNGKNLCWHQRALLTCPPGIDICFFIRYLSI